MKKNLILIAIAIFFNTLSVHAFENDLINNPDIALSWNLIKKADTITLLGHSGPDGDAISSCAALEHVLHNLDKTVETIYPNMPKNEMRLHARNILINEHNQTPDLIIICDTACDNRTYLPEAFKNIPIINIDHHENNTINGTYNFVNTKSSSACEELCCILDAFDPKLIDQYTAECLLAGILSDSLNLQTQNTTAQTMDVVAYLMKRGANLYMTAQEASFKKDAKTMALMGYIMNRVIVLSPDNADLYVVTQKNLKKFNLTYQSLDGLINFLSQLTTSDIIGLVYETPYGGTSVSLRSKKTDVNEIAKAFGGGGHIHAAGIISKEPIATIFTKLSQHIKNLF